MKIKFLLGSLVVIFSLFLYSTNAYFTAESKTTNVITTDSVDITLIEKQKTETGELIDYDSSITHKVCPGDRYSKIAYVENVGTQPCYVRIHLEMEHGEELLLDIPESWIPQEDNWYLYDQVLEIGTATEPIFTTVSFPLSMGNEYLGKEIQITLQAEAVQSKHNESYLEENKEKGVSADV